MRGYRGLRQGLLLLANHLPTFKRETVVCPENRSRSRYSEASSQLVYLFCFGRIQPHALFLNASCSASTHACDNRFWSDNIRKDNAEATQGMVGYITVKQPTENKISWHRLPTNLSKSRKNAQILCFYQQQMGWTALSRHLTYGRGHNDKTQWATTIASRNK